MNYRYYKETQLVPLAANGDKDAVAELLMVRYREQLVSSARSVNALTEQRRHRGRAP